MAQKPAQPARRAWKWSVRLTALILAAVIVTVFVLNESVDVVVSTRGYSGDAAAVVRDGTVSLGRGDAALNTLIGSTEFFKKDALGRARDILSARIGPKESFDVCYNFASIHIAQGEYAEALPYIDACIRSGKEMGADERAALWLKKGSLLVLTAANDAALSALETALSISPTAVGAHYVMMQIYVERGDLARAIDSMKAYRRSVDDDETRTVLGDLLAADGRYSEAEGIYTLLVDGGQAGGHAQFMRGVCRLQSAALDTADADFSACVEAGTELAMSLYYRGVIRLKGERYAAAEADFSAAIDQNREGAAFMELKYNRGVSRMAQGNYPDAAADFRASYESGEAVKDSLFYGGMCELQIGGNARAAALFDACLENGWALESIAYYRGMAHLNLGHADQAAADFAVSLDAGLFAGESAYYAGLSHMALGQYAEAAERFAQSCARAPQDADVPLADCLYNRGLCLIEIGDSALAEEVLLDAVAAGKPSAQAAYPLGVARYRQGAHLAAISAFDESIAADLNAFDSRINRGLCHMALEQYDEAIEDFTACLEMDARSDIARYYRGLCHRALGRLDLAEADLMAAVGD